MSSKWFINLKHDFSLTNTIVPTYYRKINYSISQILMIIRNIEQTQNLSNFI